MSAIPRTLPRERSTPARRDNPVAEADHWFNSRIAAAPPAHVNVWLAMKTQFKRDLATAPPARVQAVAKILLARVRGDLAA